MKKDEMPDFNVERQQETIPDESDVKKMQHQIDELYQKVHEKGLEVGLSNVIVGDIAMIVGLLDRMSNIWADEKTLTKEKEDDERIQKLLRNGQEILACHESVIQSLKLRQEREKVSTFLWVLKEKLTMLQGRMIGKDIHEYGR